MAVISGKDGTLKQGTTTIANVTNWKVNQISNNSAWASNSTSGFKNRVAGVKDWNGTFSMKRDTSAVVPITIGTIYALHLLEDGTKEYSGDAIIDNIEEAVDIDNGESISLEVTFSGAGALTVPS